MQFYKKKSNNNNFQYDIVPFWCYNLVVKKMILCQALCEYKLSPSCLNLVLTTFMPTQKHSYATAKNVEFCSLLLDQVTALLAKRLARITSFFLLLLLLLLSTILACVAFLHCHELNEFLAICVLLLICHHIAVNLVVENMVASASTRYLYSSVDISIWVGR